MSLQSDSQQSPNSSCDIDKASKGRIVGYKLPGGEGGGGVPGPVTEGSMLAQHLMEMNNILDRNNNLLESINNFLSLNYEPPTESWFEVKATTTSVTPDQLDTATNPVMNQDQTTLDATQDIIL